MTKLIETDEEVEKAGKVTWRGARVSRAFRRKEAVGRGADGARDGKRYAGGIGGQLAVRDSLRSKGSFAGMKNGSYSRARQLVNSRRGKLRNGVVRKSGEPLEALDSAIEKARGLLPKGGSRAMWNRMNPLLGEKVKRSSGGRSLSRYLAGRRKGGLMARGTKVERRSSKPGAYK